jgi:inosine/guanosine/xanthosine phosphorylase family protein
VSTTDFLNTDPFAAARAAADYIAEETGVDSHDVALVLGSGWAEAADLIGETTATLSAEEVPGFHAPAVVGHVGTIRSVLTREGKRALVLGARTHYYEGKGVRAVVHGIRTAAAAGCSTLVLTNGCGGLNENWAPGTPVLISDHINLTAASPLEGATFVDLTDLYSPRIRGIAREVDATLDEGIYVQFPGPHYETPAEVQYAKRIGADLVGMSTALEAIAGRHAGMEVFGISLVTNLAAGHQPAAAQPRGSPRVGAGSRPPDFQAARRNHRPALGLAHPRAGAASGPVAGASWAGKDPWCRKCRANDDSVVPMTSSDADFRLLNEARDWAAQDPDPETTASLLELVRLVEEGSPVARQELEDSFRGTLQFGTAGLRAALGPGPNRMNRAVVRRAAAGLADFLLRAVGEASPGTRPRAVVGYDARYNSDIFAAETAAIFTAAGIETFLMPSALPTPLLAYAVRALECDGGVMVTASHNPPQDNGYKVYLGRHAVTDSGNGAQIVTPYDAEIAARINATGPLETITLAPGGWTVLDGSVAAAYQQATAALALPEYFPARNLRIVLTPMHGVGGETALAVLNAAGFTDVTLVAEQAQPDPDFPTVNFPNPEEPGALDLALETAERLDADIVIANDPDADRAAVAAKDPDTGAWRMLRGDEVGALLGAHVAARLAAADGSAGGGDSRACSRTRSFPPGSWPGSRRLRAMRTRKR